MFKYIPPIVCLFIFHTIHPYFTPIYLSIKPFIDLSHLFMHMYVMKGDFKKAKELCDELNSLSTLRFDPTNPDLRGEWDVRTLGIKDIVVNDNDTRT